MDKRKSSHYTDEQKIQHHQGWAGQETAKTSPGLTMAFWLGIDQRSLSMLENTLIIAAICRLLAPGSKRTPSALGDISTASDAFVKSILS